MSTKKSAKAPLRVGEMFIELPQKTTAKPPKFELVAAVEVTDDIREVLREAGYDCADLY